MTDRRRRIRNNSYLKNEKLTDENSSRRCWTVTTAEEDLAVRSCLSVIAGWDDRPRRRRNCSLAKDRVLRVYTTLHDVISQKTSVFINTVVSTENHRLCVKFRVGDLNFILL